MSWYWNVVDVSGTDEERGDGDVKSGETYKSVAEPRVDSAGGLWNGRLLGRVLVVIHCGLSLLNQANKAVIKHVLDKGTEVLPCHAVELHLLLQLWNTR